MSIQLVKLWLFSAIFVIFQSGSGPNGLQQDYENAVLAGLSGIVNALASVLETRDPYTSGHTHRVADLAEAIGRELRLDPSTTEGLRISALVNDIGKIAIPAKLYFLRRVFKKSTG